MVRISAADVGSRVSVRSRISGDPLGRSTTDIVGRLVSWTGGALVIERRNGTVASLDEADLLAGKVLPEMSPSRKDR